ncbi:MAG TPA: hypothetical protein VGG72_18825 [Bryobacteraceae bacterium]
MFPRDLEENAFRASNGEFAWTRSQIQRVIEVLFRGGFGILGGDLWWVRDGAEGWTGVIPPQRGVPAVYSWETTRRPSELWFEFVERSAADSLAAVERWPAPDDLPPDFVRRILYNLIWTSEHD